MRVCYDDVEPSEKLHCWIAPEIDGEWMAAVRRGRRSTADDVLCSSDSDQTPSTSRDGVIACSSWWILKIRCEHFPESLFEELTRKSSTSCNIEKHNQICKTYTWGWGARIAVDIRIHHAIRFYGMLGRKWRRAWHLQWPDYIQLDASVSVLPRSCAKSTTRAEWVVFLSQ